MSLGSTFLSSGCSPLLCKVVLGSPKGMSFCEAFRALQHPAEEMGEERLAA